MCVAQSAFGLDRLRRLFLDGRILEMQPGDEESCTHCVVRQAMQAGPIFYGESQHFLWDPKTRKRDYSEALQACATVVQLMLERLQCEFPPSSIEMCFSVFSVNEAAAEQAAGVQTWQTFEVSAEIRVRKLLREGLKITHDQTIHRAFRDFMSSLHRLVARARDISDNRTGWAEERLSSSGCSAWHELISFYLAQEDGSCRVERAHAHGKRLLQSHAGPLEGTGTSYSDLLEVKLDGPSCAEEIAKQSAQGLEMTEFAREFLQAWRLRHGARFRVYSQGRRKGCPGAQRSRDDSDRAFRARQLRAMRARSERDRDNAQGEASSVLPGLTQREAAECTGERPAADAPGLVRFRTRSQLIKSNNREAARHRHSNPRGPAFKKPKLERGNNFSQRDATTDPSEDMAKFLLSLKRLKLVDACQEACPMPDIQGIDFRVRRVGDHDGGFMTFCAQSHLVILDSLDELASKRGGTCLFQPWRIFMFS